MTRLSTDDLRVCELLAEGGWWTAWDLTQRFWWGGWNVTDALLGLSRLVDRGLVERGRDERDGNVFAITPDGLRALRGAGLKWACPRCGWTGYVVNGVLRCGNEGCHDTGEYDPATGERLPDAW